MSKRVRGVPVLLLVLATLAACGGSGGGGSAPQGLAIDQWTWIDVPGTSCSDGTPTGLAVRPATDHDTTVLVFLMGGGACWGSGAPFACDGVLPPATPGPYGKAQFDEEAQVADGSIFDRRIPATPFGGATLVFIPYCTGDVHWGKSTEPYGSAGFWRHAGASNLALDVAWLSSHLAAPGKLVVAGSSAGGFGTLLAHDLARKAWPDAQGYLIDDSGPPLVGSAIPDGERQAWYTAWNLRDTVGPLCGTACESDLSQAVAALQAKYPSDRLALLSHLQDATIAAFIGRSGIAYQAALLDLVDQRFQAGAPSAARRAAFLVPGTDHVLLGDMTTHVIDGTSLPEWLGQMIDDDAGWTTLGHP